MTDQHNEAAHGLQDSATKQVIEELRLIADETLGVGMTRIGGAVVKAVEALESQAREIERLSDELENTLVSWGQVRLELAALTASAPMPGPARQYIESEKLCDSCGESEICCRPLLRDAKQSLTASAPNHSEQVRQMVPEGFRVMKPTSAVVRDGDRWEIYAPCGSGGIVHEDDVTDWVVRKLLDAAAAPSAGSQEQE